MIQNHGITDPDVRVLVDKAATLEPNYMKSNREWVDSPFAWILPCPPAQIGAIGKHLVTDWLESQGFTVMPFVGKGADRIVNNKRVAIKFSTLWDEGIYKFQQIREQEYEILICLGISPFDAHAWVFSKEFLMEQRGILPGLDIQHAGKGGQDTAWIDVRLGAPEQWLSQGGGTLRSATKVLSELLRELD